MRLIGIFIVGLMLASPLSDVFGQDAMRRAANAAWKKRQTEQREIEQDLNRTSKDTREAFEYQIPRQRDFQDKMNR